MIFRSQAVDQSGNPPILGAGYGAISWLWMKPTTQRRASPTTLNKGQLRDDQLERRFKMHKKPENGTFLYNPMTAALWFEEREAASMCLSRMGSW